ncbi:MAG: DUF4058 domain-containing protein [Planctomycetes bacterium]|nr:DUF4058 domain-containing protein [Planctomycetota bacterium]
MPLLDHFHLPLSLERHWESFHTGWAWELMAYLNQGGLPKGYFAEAQVQLGGRVEVDVASLEGEGPGRPAPDSNGGVAIVAEPLASVMTMPAVFPDEFEVLVLDRSGGPNLVGAIELVSPGNKDRPAARRAFATKCAAYLHAGVGVVVVDVVTDHHFNLHDELVSLMRQDNALRFPGGRTIYVAAYRPTRREDIGDEIEIRLGALAVGEPLPSALLALRRGPMVTIDLESTYTATRNRSQL